MSEETLRLIEKVREHTFLYDTSHKLYKDVSKRAEVWTKIAQDLNMTDDAAKIKWKSLRDSYIRYKKAGKFTTGQVRRYRKLGWSSHLQFLDCCVRSRPRNNMLVHSSRGTTDEPQQEKQQEQQHSSELRQDDSQALQTTPTVLPFSPTDESSDVDKVIKFLEKRRKKDEYLDDVGHLFLSYAQSFRKFSPRSQAMLKMELATLFGRAEIAELNASMLSTVPPPHNSSVPAPQMEYFEGKVEYQQSDFSVVTTPHMIVSNGVAVNSIENT